jgi:hypothetical protein
MEMSAMTESALQEIAHQLEQLAIEQYTANLIAYQANVERSYAKKMKIPRSDQAAALNRQIIDRLGLS